MNRYKLFLIFALLISIDSHAALPTVQIPPDRSSCSYSDADDPYCDVVGGVDAFPFFPVVIQQEFGNGAQSIAAQEQQAGEQFVTLPFFFLTCGGFVSCGKGRRERKAVADHHQIPRHKECAIVCKINVTFTACSDKLTCPFCPDLLLNKAQAYVRHISRHQPVRRAEDGSYFVKNKQGQYTDNDFSVVQIT